MRPLVPVEELFSSGGLGYGPLDPGQRLGYRLGYGQGFSLSSSLSSSRGPGYVYQGLGDSGDEKHSDELGYGLASVLGGAREPPAHAVLPACTSIMRQFSGHSYRFRRELDAAHPDPTRIPWSDVLQWVLSLSQSTEFARREKRIIFEELVHVFVSTCEPFAKLLIDESFLPPDQQSVKPDIRFGGIAGGKKFRIHEEGTQLFKLAEDVCQGNMWLYGGHQRSDRLAMKSAGHELKSAQALLNAGVAELHIPLMCVVTYRGRRVMCASLLPVKGKSTLVQGKDNIHDRVRVPPPHIEAVMADMGAKLFIGKTRKLGEEIYGPFDMEIHLGTDGLLYMIDAARLFPPEYRGGHLRSEQFYQLYRPELLRLAGIPVLSDALQTRDKEAAQNLIRLSAVLDMAIEEVTDVLSSDDIPASRSELKDLFHRLGVNMRHLGTVLQPLGEETKSKILGLQERATLKTLQFPQQLTRQDLERILSIQRDSLCNQGPQRMQLVPTLLQLASCEERDATSFERAPAFQYKNAFRPSGAHPLVLAFDICVESDVDFKFDPLSLEISSCSHLALRVIFEIITYDRTLAFPSFDSLVSLLARSQTSSLVTDRMKRWVLAGGEDDVDIAMNHAGRDGEWGVATELSQRYGKEFQLARTRAEMGVLDREAIATLPMELKEGMLHAAARGNQSSVVEALIAASVNPDATGPDHWTALIIAASSSGRENLDAARTLLRLGASVNATTSHGYTALMWAAANLHLSMANLLLDAGADPNMTAGEGFTALMFACGHGSDEAPPVVSALLSKSAHAYAQSGDGTTSLLCAAGVGSLPLVSILLQHGADANVSRNPLALALQRRHFEVAEYLVDKGGADASLALSHAVHDVSSVSWLIDQKANVNARDAQGYTLLMRAIAMRDSALASFLIERRADVNAVATDGSETALSIAHRQAASSLLRTLLESNADLTGCKPSTAMAIAMQEQLLQWLSEAPVDLLATELAAPGLRAIEIATWMQWSPILDILERRGMQYDDSKSEILKRARDGCTFPLTGPNFQMQYFQSCASCWPDSSVGAGVCRACATVCHAGHRLRPASFLASYCDCHDLARTGGCDCHFAGTN